MSVCIQMEAHTQEERDMGLLHLCWSNHLLFQCLHTNFGVKVPTFWLLPLKCRKNNNLVALQQLPALPETIVPVRIHFSHEDCDISGESSICNCWNIICSDCAHFKHQKTKAYFLCSCFSLPYEGRKPPNAVELFSVSISCLSHFPPYLFFSI